MQNGDFIILFTLTFLRFGNIKAPCGVQGAYVKVSISIPSFFSDFKRNVDHIFFSSYFPSN